MEAVTALYERITDTRPELDDIGHEVIMVNGTSIPMDAICEIEDSILEDIENI